jgi:hypothetical protein
MGIVVDKMAGRLKIEEIASDEDKGQEYIKEILDRNDFTSIQGMMWRGAIRDGDSFVMVDPLTMKWTVEPAYDGFSGMFAIMRQGLDYPLWACKLYSQADLDLSGTEPSTTVTMKVTVYQPNKVSFWKANSGEQELMADAQDNEHEKAWPLGNVPVIHYGNTKDSFTQYGESEIRKAIPPQNVINRTLHSMVMASEFGAFKVAWSVGLELDKKGITPGSVLNLVFKDKNGNAVSEITPEQVEFLKAVKVGEFDATNISQYTNQLEKLVMQITQITSTPIYGVTFSGNLSGEALKQLEVGLVGKCERFQNENTSSVKLLIELTAKMQKVFKTPFGNPPKLGTIKVIWMSAELRDNAVDKVFSENQILWQTVATVMTANPNIPPEAIFRSFGWDDTKLKEFGEQKLAWIKQQQEDVIPTERL